MDQLHQFFSQLIPRFIAAFTFKKAKIRLRAINLFLALNQQIRMLKKDMLILLS